MVFCFILPVASEFVSTSIIINYLLLLIWNLFMEWERIILTHWFDSHLGRLQGEVQIICPLPGHPTSPNYLIFNSRIQSVEVAIVATSVPPCAFIGVGTASLCWIIVLIFCGKRFPVMAFERVSGVSSGVLSQVKSITNLILKGHHQWFVDNFLEFGKLTRSFR